MGAITLLGYKKLAAIARFLYLWHTFVIATTLYILCKGCSTLYDVDDGYSHNVLTFNDTWKTMCTFFE